MDCFAFLTGGHAEKKNEHETQMSHRQPIFGENLMVSIPQPVHTFLPSECDKSKENGKEQIFHTRMDLPPITEETMSSSSLSSWNSSSFDASSNQSDSNIAQECLVEEKKEESTEELLDIWEETLMKLAEKRAQLNVLIEERDQLLKQAKQ